LNIKNIVSRKKIPVNELIAGNHYYIQRKTNFLRIEVISINEQKKIKFKIVGTNSPLEGAICELDMDHSECTFFHIFMPLNFDNKNDTIKAIGESTTHENAELLRDLVHIVIDEQATTEGIEKFKNLLQILESRKIITKNEIYERFFKEEGKETNEDIEQFLVNRLLPPLGQKIKSYTHKGWDHDYSLEENNEIWSVNEIKQSWEAKKYMLTKVLENVYSISEPRAKALSVIFYNVHRLRDIQYNRYNEDAATREKYLADACIEMEKYIYPFTRDEYLTPEDKAKTGHLYYLNKIQKILYDWKQKRNNFWQLLDEPINKLLGPFDNSENGCLTEVVSRLSK